MTSEPGRAISFEGFAVVVGVSRYERLPILPETKDAGDVAAVLRDPALCAYPPSQVEVLEEEAATRDAILEALERVAASARTTSSVFVYFSGHGGRSTSGAGADCYLMPVDSTWRSAEDLARTAISGNEVAAVLRRIVAGRVTVVLDCCRAAGIAEPKDAEASALDPRMPAQALAALVQGRGRAVLAASTADGLAYAVPGRRNSLFTHHLLEGLRGAAGGTGGVIRVCDVFDYVQRRIVADMPAQRPVFRAELEENYPLALHRGGQVPALVVPHLDDAFAYDAFVSYRRVPPDRAWVEQQLLPPLEGLGLRLCLAHRDFRLGAPRIREMEKAVGASRYTVAVLSPRYLEGPFEEFQALLAQHQSLEARGPRFIPLLREDCRPSLGIPHSRVARRDRRRPREQHTDAPRPEVERTVPAERLGIKRGRGAKHRLGSPRCPLAFRSSPRRRARRVLCETPTS